MFFRPESSIWVQRTHIFGPKPKLNYSESSLLAALPKAPSKYNPYRNKKLAKHRRNLVINNLFENSYINSEEHERLIKSEIKL